MTQVTDITARNLLGTRDWFGQEERERQLLVETVRRIYESFGFEPLTTPAMEFLAFLYKEGSETARKIFEVRISRTDLTKKPEHQPLGLRFDHTVPLARFASQHANAIVLPWKRYAIGPVWRAEKPQQGRLREFTQIDFDTVGASSIAADAEVIAVLCTVANAVGLESFSALFNHRQLLDAMAKDIGATNQSQVTEILRSWDKIGKVEFKDAPEALRKVQLDETAIQNFGNLTLALRSLKGSNDHIIAGLRKYFSHSKGVQDALDVVEKLLDLCSKYSCTNGRIVFRQFLARGFDYYTGPVFEMVAGKSRNSFAGGGRFDRLISDLGGPDLPATGASFGLERFVEIVREQGSLFRSLTRNDVYVSLFNQDSTFLSASLRAAEIARNAGLKVEVYSGDHGIGRQLTIANRKGYKVALLIGPNEIDQSAVTVKDMSAEYNPNGLSNQRLVSLTELESFLLVMLR